MDGRHLSSWRLPRHATGGQIFTQDVWNTTWTRTWTVACLPRARGWGAGAPGSGTSLHRRRGYQPRIKAITGFCRSMADAVAKRYPATQSRSHLADAVLGGKIYAIASAVLMTTWSPKTRGWWDPAKPNTWTPVAVLPKLGRIFRGPPCDQQSYHRRRSEIDHQSSVGRDTYDPLSTPGQHYLQHDIQALPGIDQQIFYTTGGF